MTFLIIVPYKYSYLLTYLLTTLTNSFVNDTTVTDMARVLGMV